jgi:hypothetical protein
MSVQREIDRHPKDKMAAFESEIIIARVAGQKDEKVQRLHTGFQGWSRYTISAPFEQLYPLFRCLPIELHIGQQKYNIGRHQKTEMAVGKL